MLERYNPILNAIKGLCPTAHIGGGAVRDTLLERPIKDIDLFLDAENTDAAAAVLRSQFGFLKVGEWKSYEMFSDPADRPESFRITLANGRKLYTGNSPSDWRALANMRRTARKLTNQMESER